MKTTTLWMTLLLVAGVLVGPSADGQEKRAQTGMKFLSVTGDARAAALGEAVTSLEGTSTSMFFNPAAMARVTGFTSAGIGYTQWIADIKHYYGSIAFSPFNGDYGVIGVSVQSVDYGTFEGTIRAENSKGYLDESDMPGLNFKPTGIAVGIGYARALSEKFSIGGNLKWVRQSLGNAINQVGANAEANTTSVWAVDFGVLYKTGYKSLNFGMTVRNFSREARYQNEGFQLPLTFKIGVSMDVFDLTDFDKKTHSLLISADAEHPRDFSEQIKIGAEYTFMQLLALRVGYVSPADEHGIAYGVGLKSTLSNVGLGVDYAYVPFGIFNGVHRFTFQFSL